MLGSTFDPDETDESLENIQDDRVRPDADPVVDEEFARMCASTHAGSVEYDPLEDGV
jgi:hypothetical protein